jgi:Protein of unknown function (DUF1553)/Protein of unknown function (DUF1549)/Planctomycete cytochrome C
MFARAYITCICLLVHPTGAAIADVDFKAEVLPILKEYCTDCHGAEVQESKLRLDTLVDALRGGDSGEPVITPGSSVHSHLIERITNSNAKLRMPPDAAPLPQQAIDILRSWVEDESQWSEARKELAKKKSDHWSFQPLHRPAVPLPSEVIPIDGFVLKRLSKDGLSLSPPAEKRRLIRRLYLVMHGLPPTPQQVDEFLKDKGEDAWPRLVERVLESPRYGERAATHWLDLVRFGETNGFETNRERPNAYPYRDWVISAFNDDKPYDQFVREQIAGDALGEPIGTGFLVAGPNDIVKGQDPLLGLMQRQDELADIVNTTGTAFLGLTTGCARCHNHKFDPILQTDYYALQAVFAGVEHAEQVLPLSPEKNKKAEDLAEQIQTLRGELAKYAKVRGTRDPVNAVENVELLLPEAQIEAKFIRFTILATSASEPCIDELQVFAGDANIALASAGANATSSGDYVHPLHKLEHLNDGQFGNTRSWIASQTNGGWAQIEFAKAVRVDRVVWGRDRHGQFADRVAIDYRIELSPDGSQWTLAASSADRLPQKPGKTSIEQYELVGLDAAESQTVRAAVAKLQMLEEGRKQVLSSSSVYIGKFAQPAETRRLYRGDPTAPREVVKPGAIESLTSLDLQLDAAEQQRRVALANWIANRDNPLTARVMVNRLWQFHFGTGLVDTPSDFGANGTLPTHPELLDWLACEFIESGWSIKELHRLILASKTWQQDSRPRADGMAVDAGSRLLWRFPTRRLEAEGIRDCILAATGKLDLQIGGPGFSAFEVELENVRHYFPKKDYGPADWRRMIYMTKVRMEKDSIFGVFDCPDGSQVTPRRSRSTTPLQALNLLNSRFVLQQAESLAERIQREGNSHVEQVRLVYEVCFGRECDAAEFADAQAFIAQQGWIQFARAVFNANEFVFIP